MFQTVTKSDFMQAFRDYNCIDNFSRAGLFVLFDYLEQYESDCDEELELDVIALCCEYAEYKNIAEFQEDYNSDYETIDDIETKTTVIKIDAESFIIQQF